MNVGCVGKTVRSLENACHVPERLRGVFTTRRYTSSRLLFTLPYHNNYFVTDIVDIVCVERAKALSSGGVLCRCVCRWLLATDQLVPVRHSVAPASVSLWLWLHAGRRRRWEVGRLKPAGIVVVTTACFCNFLLTAFAGETLKIAFSKVREFVVEIYDMTVLEVLPIIDATFRPFSWLDLNFAEFSWNKHTNWNNL